MLHWEIEVPATISSLDRVQDWAIDILQKIEIRTKKAKQLLLCLEEAIVNIIKHGYTEDKGVIQVAIDFQDHTITVSIKDWAHAYNPLERKIFPSDETSLEEKEVGGLGLLFIQNLSDEVLYERRNNANILTLKVKN